MMTKSTRNIRAREQLLSTQLLGEGSANRLLAKFKNERVSQLDLEHVQAILWVHFLQDLLEFLGDEAMDPIAILGKGQRAIFDEAMAILDGTDGWDRDHSDD